MTGVKSVSGLMVVSGSSPVSSLFTCSLSKWEVLSCRFEYGRTGATVRPLVRPQCGILRLPPVVVVVEGGHVHGGVVISPGHAPHDPGVRDCGWLILNLLFSKCLPEYGVPVDWSSIPRLS